MCGGLNGCPTRTRSGCLHFDCITLGVIPEELDAMNESAGVAASMSAKSLILNSGRSGAFSWTKSASRQRRLHVRGEGQAVARCAGRQADGGELVPRVVHVLAQFRFRVRGGIGRDHVEAACQILGGPARADDSGADDGDSVDGFVEGHVHSPKWMVVRCATKRAVPRRRCR